MRSQAGLMIQGICLVLFTLPSAPPRCVAADELRPGSGLVAKDLRAWHGRLSRIDDAAPQPGLLSVDRVIAYEENPQFAYACGERTQPREDAPPLRFRRLLLLKPDTLVVDELWAAESAKRISRVLWATEPIAVTPAGLVPAGIHLDKQKWLDTEDPIGNTAPAASVPEASSGDDRAVRTVSVFQWRDSDSEQRAAFELKPNETHLQLTIRTAAEEFLVELPRCYADPGWIATASSGDAARIARRPLPAGILPHGEQGIRLIERWDRAYRGGGQPGWDSGLVAEDLKQAVEQGHLTPCPVVELGCGSGTNAIYLAGKGFDVTAIDVAPTALSLADAKAQKAGVRVRWVLADVLNLPELGTFDLVFDRGCYHNVRYVDADGFVASARRLTVPGSKLLILSLNRDSAPGVREPTMRDDFGTGFEVVWLKESEIRTGTGGTSRRPSWSLLLQRK